VRFGHGRGLLNVLLFIDANQYLRLFGLNGGKKLFAPLEGQAKHIFITQQIVDEVDRNKVKVAGDFFLSSISNIPSGSIPDHILGVADNELTGWRKTLSDMQKLRADLKKQYAETLRRVSQSQDELTKRLEPLFQTAVTPTEDELMRARERKERGNPPGKHNNPLGDQITWEQLLTACKTRSCKRLWIISDDDDYSHKTSDDVLINAFLYKDLCRVCGDEIEVYCFRDLLRALEHFKEKSGLKVEKMPSKKDATKIREELDALATAGTAPYFASSSGGHPGTVLVPASVARAILKPLFSKLDYSGTWLDDIVSSAARKPEIGTCGSE
jgi:hypothetical protein